MKTLTKQTLMCRFLVSHVMRWHHENRLWLRIGDCGLSGAGQAVQLRCGSNSYKNVQIYSICRDFCYC